MASLVRIEPSLFRADEALTADVLRSLFASDSISGKLFWKRRDRHLFSNEQSCSAWNTKYAGKEALTAIGGHGYHHGSALGVALRAHRVMWCLHNGSIPKGMEIDHIDRVKTNNSLSNLRIATRSQNARNTSGHNSRRVSEFKGVRRSANGKWDAVSSDDSGSVYLGRFPNQQLAAEAYNSYVSESHGEFAFLNKLECANG